MIAVKIRDIDSEGHGVGRLTDGHVKSLYELTPPLNGHRYVIVSGVRVMGEPETYIFPAEPDGQVTRWAELPGSFKGAIDHVEALREAGYEIEP